LPPSIVSTGFEAELEAAPPLEHELSTSALNTKTKEISFFTATPFLLNHYGRDATHVAAIYRS
jgi:hypothetical protein